MPSSQRSETGRFTKLIMRLPLDKSNRGTQTGVSRKADWSNDNASMLETLANSGTDHTLQNRTPPVRRIPDRSHLRILRERTRRGAMFIATMLKHDRLDRSVLRRSTSHY